MSSKVDLKLDTDDRIVKANRDDLASHSQYFKAMFSRNFQESTTECVILKVGKIMDFETLEMIVDYSKEGGMDVVNKNTIRNLIIAANFFQMTQLVDKLLLVVAEGEVVDTNNVLGLWQLESIVTGKQWKLIETSLKEHISANIDMIVCEPSFLSLDVETLKEILSWKSLKIETTKTILILMKVLILLQCMRFDGKLTEKFLKENILENASANFEAAREFVQQYLKTKAALFMEAEKKKIDPHKIHTEDVNLHDCGLDEEDDDLYLHDCGLDEEEDNFYIHDDYEDNAY